MSVSVRGTGIAYANNASSVVFTIPVGSLAGDTCSIFVEHGWTVTTPSGWTSINNSTGTNVSGACFYKVLTSGDISTGSVTISFSGTYYGVVAGITFVGSVTALTSTFARNSTGATTRTLGTSSASATGDYAVYFASGRGNVTITSGVGAGLQTSSNTNASGVLAGLSLASDGATSTTFAFSAAPTGDYEGIVIFRTTLVGAALAEQAVVYALASQPATQLRANQIVVLVPSAAETSSGQFLVKTHQVVAYALVRGKVDSVNLRAWTFLQDDHLFYGLQLGNTSTIVYDTTTQQWAQWYSPGFNYWRAEDVTDWEGFNLACDTENGTIWKIDPTGRLDAGTALITSQVTGQATIRGRRTVPCFMAELACSQANPAASGSSVQLRTSDDATASWTDHGTISGNALGTATLFRWFGLGLMEAPGRIFELTNIGYARRLDGMDLEVGK